MRRCVIVGGAPIARPEELRQYLRADDFFLYCDCGLRHVDALGRAPDLIVGDFDSFDNPHAAAETIVLPREKDDTDTFFAVKEALRRGFEDFLLIGAAFLVFLTLLYCVYKIVFSLMRRRRPPLAAIGAVAVCGIVTALSLWTLDGMVKKEEESLPLICLEELSKSDQILLLIFSSVLACPC